MVFAASALLGLSRRLDSESTTTLAGGQWRARGGNRLGVEAWMFFAAGRRHTRVADRITRPDPGSRIRLEGPQQPLHLHVAQILLGAEAQC